MSRRARGTGDLFPGPERAPASYWIAHIDGGARGNPGPAGYGVVITDETGRKIDTLSQYLGHQTNNYAEYSGLLAALRSVIEHGGKALKVVSDSELMVKQLRAEYKVKNPTLQELYAQARKLIAQLDWFDIQHVRRESNQEADRLANAAMDKGMGRSAATPVSPSLNQLPEFEGVVRNGMIKLVNGELPDGTRVQVRVKR